MTSGFERCAHVRRAALARGSRRRVEPLASCFGISWVARCLCIADARPPTMRAEPVSPLGLAGTLPSQAGRGRIGDPAAWRLSRWRVRGASAPSSSGRHACVRSCDVSGRVFPLASQPPVSLRWASTWHSVLDRKTATWPTPQGARASRREHVIGRRDTTTPRSIRAWRGRTGRRTLCAPRSAEIGSGLSLSG